ncbi:MAG TPA: hypothetical protein VFF06_28075 [Polyangia bacterium]|nr:hypothetical protein [Polyangia bacterium]
MDPDFKDREAFDPDERELCSDGSCTGLLGADGRCKVCGRAGDGSPGVPRESSNGEPSGEPNREPNRDSDGAFADDDRQLCPDGACTGLIGSDGKCKVCGLSAAS